jgi:hypothetical protein
MSLGILPNTAVVLIRQALPPSLPYFAFHLDLG